MACKPRTPSKARVSGRPVERRQTARIPWAADAQRQGGVGNRGAHLPQSPTPAGYRSGEVSQTPLALPLDFLVPMFLSVLKSGGAPPARWKNMESRKWGQKHKYQLTAKGDLTGFIARLKSEAARVAAVTKADERRPNFIATKSSRKRPRFPLKDLSLGVRGPFYWKRKTR